MSSLQHSFSSRWAHVLILLLALNCQAFALNVEYCSDINTSSNNKNSSIYQSNGLCRDFCFSSYAFAIVQIDGCWCSNYAPASTTTGCDYQCPGYPEELCGSDKLYGYIALQESPLGTQGARISSPASSTAAAPPPTTPAPVTIISNPSPVTVYETIFPPPPSPATSSSSSAEILIPSTTSSKPTSKTPTTTSTPSSSSTWTPTPVTSLETVTGSVRTVTVTPTVPPNAQATEPVTKAVSSGGLNTGAAVGLTIGLVAIIAIIGSIIYFCIRKRRESQAEEYAAASHRGSSAGLGAAPSRTMSQNSRFVLNTDGHRVVENWETDNVAGSRRSRLMPVDPRLDPFSPVYQRDNKSRESVNTIRDDHDYSRRVHQQAPILRATNPDEHVD